MMPKPDIPELQALSEELEALANRDGFTRAEFDRLWPQFVEAADEHGNVLGVLSVY